MGRCIAFNFGPDELREKLNDVKWFVYSPEFESAFLQEHQNFRTAIELGDTSVDDLKAELIQLFRLKAIPNEKLFQYSKNLSWKFVKYDAEPLLYVMLFSTLEWSAISQAQIDDMKKIDQQLSSKRYKIGLPHRQFDYVFGPSYLLAHHFTKRFENQAKIFIPSQQGSVWRSSIDEVNKKIKDNKL